MSIYEFTRRKSSLDLGPGADGALPRTPVKHTRGIEFDSRTVHHLRPAPDNVNDPLAGLPRQHFGAILTDPPWHFAAWAKYKELPDGSKTRATERFYSTMSAKEIAALPVAELAAPDCVLFLWTCWPMLADAWLCLKRWGFEYKTCAFAWTRADNRQPDFFQDELPVQVGLGYWTRANSEPCLLATRGKPKRLNADVRQAIIAPRREHSRKPDGIHERIERLVGGPYLELFARQSRPGWTTWGNERNQVRRGVAMSREHLPNRRASEHFSFELSGLRFTATASWFDDGRLGEIFVSNHRADSHADACAKDAAILASIALQFGVPLDVLRKALLRDSQGRPGTPIGYALDLLADKKVQP
jgi:N6-adenosine-specific RNA methylase IME4